MKFDPDKKFKTKCGFDVEIYRSKYTNIGQVIGAIKIPAHPAAFPGWQSCEWDGATGKCLRKDNDCWDLQVFEEIIVTVKTQMVFSSEENYMKFINNDQSAKAIGFVDEIETARKTGVPYIFESPRIKYGSVTTSHITWEKK